jgi:outer membrane receptor for ferric coprogen and ferric-rhodotorulic acid
VPSGFADYFNTPKYRFNTGVSNSGFGKDNRVGFNIMFRWQDNFQWQGELANGPIDSYSTIDAQVSYKFPRIKSLIKLGGTNVFNKYYKTGYANPEIGGLYYVSYGFNL